MFQQEKTERLLRTIPKKLARARTADKAIRNVADEVRSLIPSIWRATLNKLVLNASQVECVAVWCDRKTELKPGLRVSTLVTAIPEVMKLGRAMVSSEHDGETSDLKRSLQAEGTQSWTLIPLSQADRVVGALTLSSHEFDAFTPDAVDFFSSLGRAAEKPLVGLLGLDN